MATDIEEISRAMDLARSEEVMDKAWKMAKRPDSCRKEADDWAKPFSLLLDRINQGFSPLSLHEPRSDIKRRLAIELQIIGKQLENGQVIQAVLLSREWVVTYCTSLLGKDLLADRDDIENMLNCQVRFQLSGKDLPEEHELIQIWGELIQLRNDIAHCGMRAGPMQSGKLITKSKDIASRLGKLNRLQS